MGDQAIRKGGQNSSSKKDPKRLQQKERVDDFLVRQQMAEIKKDSQLKKIAKEVEANEKGKNIKAKKGKGKKKSFQ